MSQYKGKLFVGCDHAAFDFKNELIARIKEHYSDIDVVDCGCDAPERCDYPDFAYKVSKLVAGGQGLGLLVCGSGIGMSMVANKVHGVRAALCWDATSARLSKEHNNSNVLCMGGRLIGIEVAWDALQSWLSAEFAEGRHTGRIELMHQYERGGES